eukprot:TRINITY_DN2543_c0_g1_i1.p1 TRINITY_DN2543_c0_g1~~TRINITY_DN2543_c0_g1_i1.p1  ORF type:complete len:518 (-),score=73.65 TRINITY_DN2543_c0_g1_i1:340-1893(-)
MFREMLLNPMRFVVKNGLDLFVNNLSDRLGEKGLDMCVFFDMYTCLLRGDAPVPEWLVAYHPSPSWSAAEIKDLIDYVGVPQHFPLLSPPAIPSESRRFFNVGWIFSSGPPVPSEMKALLQPHQLSHFDVFQAPAEILVHLLNCLPPLSLYAVSLVCRTFYHLSCTDLIYRKWLPSGPSTTPSGPSTNSSPPQSSARDRVISSISERRVWINLKILTSTLGAKQCRISCLRSTDLLSIGHRVSVMTGVKLTNLRCICDGMVLNLFAGLSARNLRLPQESTLTFKEFYATVIPSTPFNNSSSNNSPSNSSSSNSNSSSPSSLNGSNSNPSTSVTPGSAGFSNSADTRKRSFSDAFVEEQLIKDNSFGSYYTFPSAFSSSSSASNGSNSTSSNSFNRPSSNSTSSNLSNSSNTASCLSASYLSNFDHENIAASNVGQAFASFTASLARLNQLLPPETLNTSPESSTPTITPTVGQRSKKNPNKLRAPYGSVKKARIARYNLNFNFGSSSGELNEGVVFC